MNTNSFFVAFRVALWLLWWDLRLLLKDWKNNILDATFWPTVLILTNGYVMPAMGLPDNYGAFNAISMLIIMASFSAWMASNMFAADLEGPRSISYELTLPLPYWLVCCKIILYFALKASIFSLMSLVIGKLILGSAFSFAHVSLLKFILIYTIINLFFGSFGLWGAVFAGSVQKHTRIELRFAGPLFFICGFSFPWSVLHTVAPLFSKLMLLTPWIYAYEGTRATILGQHDYLSYWVCVGMLCLFTLLFGAWGLWLFKKRLDCV